MDRLDLETAELRTRGNWHEIKGKIRKEYGDLTDDDLEYQEGQEEEWYGKISNKIGKTVDDVKDWVKNIF